MKRLTAAALVAHVGDAKQFKNGRQMAAYLGMTPREHSSGGKQVDRIADCAFQVIPSHSEAVLQMANHRLNRTAPPKVLPGFALGICACENAPDPRGHTASSIESALSRKRPGSTDFVPMPQQHAHRSGYKSA